MFRAKTLFVLGAGASFEADLPVGDKLLEQIVDLTDIRYDYRHQTHGDRLIVDALRIILQEEGGVEKLTEHIHAARRLRQSAQQGLSIDNVIDALEDEKIELVGKLGIVRAILKAEGASAKFRRPEQHIDGLNLRNFEATWYSSLTKILTENKRRSDFENVFRNLEFIVFNYDRCLEQFLQFSLASYFHVPVTDAQAAINGLIVHRPYGLVGRLPWQAGDSPSIGFGEGTAEDLARVVQEIRTFTEQVEESDAVEAMRQSVRVADRIVFLGFGFHRQNVALIASEIKPHTEIFGTCLKVSKADQDVITSELRTAFEFDWTGVRDLKRVTLAELTCNQFFLEYWRTMTAQTPEE